MTTPEPVKADSRVGQVVSGRYRIQQLLGEGGMGSVYLAEHTHMKKRVALKLLHPEMSQNAEVSARFEREAVAAAHIEHPNVAAATDFGKTDDGSFFLVLEYLEGTSLREAIAPGPISVARALKITRQIALGLERAHASGIVHRDLKPENVMLVTKNDDPDFVKVLDFGIAKVTDAQSAMGERTSGNSNQILTRLGTIIGTPEYMAPEQALGEAVTAQSDLYAVGVMLYEMLTGKHPFDPPDRTTMLTLHIVAPVPTMRDRAPDVDVPPAVEAVTRSLLEKEMKNRPASGRALADAIDAAAATSGVELSGSTPAPPGSNRAGGGVVLKDTPPPKSVAADAFAPTTLGEKAIAPDAFSRVKSLPRQAQIGLAAAVPLLFIGLVVVLVLVFRGPKTDGPTGLTGGSGGEGSAEGTAAKAITAPPGQLKAAAAQGIEAVEALAKDFPDDPAVKRQLALSYHLQGRSAEAMTAVRALLEADAKAADDDEIVQIVSSTAAKNTKATGDADDEAFTMLETLFGERGVDALVDLSRNNNWALKARAMKSVQKPDVRAKASASAGVYLDFASASSCGQRRELLPRAKESGDARLLPSLKALKQTNGCRRSVFGRRVDCWPCLREDSSLEDAITAIETRAGPK